MLETVSVTEKRTVSPSFFLLPFSTSPPRRSVCPTGAVFLAISEGLTKKTKLLLNALATRNVAMPNAQSATAMNAILLCLVFICVTFAPMVQISEPRHQSLLSPKQQNHFAAHGDKGHRIRTPDVERVPAHGKEFRPVHVLSTPGKCAALLRSTTSVSQPAFRSRS